MIQPAGGRADLRSTRRLFVTQATVAEDEEQFRRVVEALVAQFQGAAGSRLLARRGASVVRTLDLSARQLVCD